MKKLILISIALTTAFAINHTASACTAINEGANDNSDCASIVPRIYDTKATLPNESVKQAAYVTSWEEDGMVSLLGLLHGRMYQAGLSADSLAFGKESYKKSFESYYNNIPDSPDTYTIEVSGNEWTSAMNDPGMSYRLKQYGNYLIGRWRTENQYADAFGQMRTEMPVYFVVNTKTGNLNLGVAQ